MSLSDCYKNSLFSEYTSNGITSDVFEIIDSETADIEKELDDVLSQFNQEQKGIVNYLISFRLFVSFIFEMFDNVGLTKKELDGLIDGFKSRKIDSDEDEIEEYSDFSSILLGELEKEDKPLDYLSFDEMFSYLKMCFDCISERSILNEFLSMRNSRLDNNKLSLGVKNN